MDCLKSRHIIYLILFITFYRLEVNGQSSQYRFNHLDVTSGLSQNTINDIFQDSEGYLWVATQDGLNRYDGYEIRQYVPDRSDSSSISDNFLWNITEDKFGGIWVCSRNAVNRLDKRSGKFQKLLTDLSESPTSVVHKAGLSYILVGEKVHSIPSNKVNKLQDSLKSVPSLGLSTNGLNPFSIKTHGEHLLLFTGAGVLLVSQENEELIPMEISPGSFVTGDNQVMEISDQRFLIGTTKGIYVFDLNSKRVAPFLHDTFQETVYAFSKGPQGYLWLSTKDGIRILDIEKGVLKDFSPKGVKSEILSTEVIFSIYKTTNNMVWVGTSNNGLYSYDPALDKFKYLDTNGGLSSSMIWSIAQVDENEYWLGTDNGVNILRKKPGLSWTGSSFLNEGLESVKPLKMEGVQGERINMIFVDDVGNKWLSVHSKGLFILDPTNRLVKKIVFNQGDVVSNQITSVIKLGQEYWVTTFNGIFIVNKLFETEERFLREELEAQYFFKAYLDSENNIWLGTNNGFYKYEVRNDRFTHFPYQANSSNSPGFYFVNDFEEAQDGSMWLATFGGGFDSFNEKDQAYYHFDNEQGLANNVISSLIKDKRGNLWLGTNRGISRFDPKDTSIVNFDVSNGLVFNETAINARYRNTEGELFFGTAGGLVVFHPDSLAANEPAQRPKFTGVKINYEDVSIAVQDGGSINLFPKDKVLSLEFATLAFRNAQKLIYEFKIDGIDDHWVVTDASNRRATYSTLPFGTHSFQVRARDFYGGTSQVASISLIVHPPLWLSWWFIIALIAFVILSIVAISRAYYRNKLKVRLRDVELKQQIQTERERISRDLHDNVGSQITHIISSLDNISYQHRETTAVKTKLNDLGDFTRSTLRFLRETIWVINKNAIRLSEFAEKAQDYGNKMCENIETGFSIEKSGEDVVLNPTMTMNLFRVFQEGINNAIKHAEATEIEVKIQGDSHEMKLWIQDNGKGFDGNHKQGHYGLGNMKDRVEEMKGQFEILSSAKGTVVKIQVPISKTTSNA